MRDDYKKYVGLSNEAAQANGKLKKISILGILTLFYFLLNTLYLTLMVSQAYELFYNVFSCCNYCWMLKKVSYTG